MGLPVNVTVTSVSFTKDFKLKLDKFVKENNISRSRFIECVLEKHIDDKRKKGTKVSSKR